MANLKAITMTYTSQLLCFIQHLIFTVSMTVVFIIIIITYILFPLEREAENITDL